MGKMNCYIQYVRWRKLINLIQSIGIFLYQTLDIDKTNLYLWKLVNAYFFVLVFVKCLSIDILIELLDLSTISIFYFKFGVL